MPTFSRLHNESEEKVSIVLPDAMRRRRFRLSCQLWWAGIATVLSIVFMIALIIVAKHSHEIEHMKDASAHSVQNQVPCPTLPQTRSIPTPLTPKEQPSTQSSTTLQPISATQSTAGSTAGTTTNAPSEETCMTPPCVEAAEQILYNMDFSVNPCDDFYQYACGGFEKKSFLPPDDSKKDVFTILGEKNLQIIQKALTSNNNALNGIESKSLIKAKEIYKQCVNIRELQKGGAEPLTKTLHDFGWYDRLISDSATLQSNWSLQDEIIKLQRIMFHPLYSVSLSVDSKNSSTYVFTSHQSGLTLNSEKDYNSTYDNSSFTEKRAAFIKYGIQVFNLIGISNRSLTEKKISAIYEFEKKLADIYVPQEDYQDVLKTYTKIKISDLQAKLGSRLNILQTVSDVYNVSDRNITYSDDSEIVTLIPQYFPQLKALLDEYNTTEKNKVLSDYLAWYLIHNTVEYLDPNFLYAQLILKDATAGVTALKPRWKVCTSKVSDLVSRAIDALYQENAFDDEDRKQVMHIVDNVTSALVDRFDSYTWLDTVTQKEAVEKSKHIVKKIGYPDYITNVTAIDEYHSMFVIGDNYFASYLNFERWINYRQRMKVNTVPDRELWDINVGEVNAYYSPSFNVIVFPAGILQAPFFDKEWPAAWNYGGMGAVVGHEISHAYDDQGSQFDELGNLKNWWTNHSITKFKKKTKCFKEQYDEYEMYGIHVSGERTLGENIADNGGLSLAFESYRKSTLPQYGLPGLDITDDQLFFLSWAQNWCIKSTEEYAKRGISNNPHSPSSFRVLGPFSNSRQFSDAFNCSAESAYNRKNKCELW